MALFKIFKGDSQNLGVTGGTHITKEGYAYFTPDDGKFYIDITSGQTPVVGTSSRDGANRICIGGGGSIDFGDILILDCGTARISGEDDVIKVQYWNCGDSSSQITETTIVMDFGNSEIPEITTNTVLYDAGNSILKE